MKNFFTIIGGMGTMATESYIHQLNLQITAYPYCFQQSSFAL